MLNIHCLLHTNAKEIHISSFYFLSGPGDFPACFLGPPLIHQWWSSCNLLYVSSFNSKCIKWTTKLSLSGACQLIEIVLPGAALVWLKETVINSYGLFYRFGHSCTDMVYLHHNLCILRAHIAFTFSVLSQRSYWGKSNVTWVAEKR